MSLSTPETIRRLQQTLYVTAKQAPARRFHGLFDKVWRGDILAHAYALSRANGGAPGRYLQNQVSARCAGAKGRELNACSASGNN